MFSLNVVAEQNALIEFLIEAVAGLITGMLRTFLFPLINFAYLIGVWAPLQIISLLIGIFRFMSRGFAVEIFNGTANPDGSYSFQFNWGSPMGMAIMYIFVISLVLFFIYFLYTFSEKNAVDDDGNPTGGQVRRFFYLKWPLLMTVALVLTPFILSFMDSIIVTIMEMFFNPEINAPFNSSQINDLKNFATGGEGIGTGSSQFALIYQLIHGDLTGITAGQNIQDTFRSLSTNCNDVYSSFNSKEEYAHFMRLVGRMQHQLEPIAEYFGSQFDTNYTTCYNIVNTLTPGTYIYEGDAQDIKLALYDLANLQEMLKAFSSNVDTLFRPGTAYDEYELFKATTADGSAASKFCILLEDFNVANTDHTSSWFKILSSDKESSLNLLLNGQDDVYSLYRASRNIYVAMSIRGPDTTCELLYSLLTKDDGWKWNREITVDKATPFDNMDLVSAVLACYGCWGMVLIIYQFTRTAIERVFYLIISWMLGWLYLANGIKHGNEAKSWYLQIIGRWLSIIFLYLIFELVSAIIPIFTDPVKNAFPDYTFGMVYAIGSTVCMLFVIEIGYQTAFTTVQSITADIYGVSHDTFKVQKSFALTEGKNFQTAMRKELSDASGFMWDRMTFQGTRDNFKYVVDSRQYWRGREDSKKLRAMKELMDTERAAGNEAEASTALAGGKFLTIGKNGERKVVSDNALHLGMPEMGTQHPKLHGHGRTLDERLKYMQDHSQEFKPTPGQAAHNAVPNMPVHGLAATDARTQMYFPTKESGYDPKEPPAFDETRPEQVYRARQQAQSYLWDHQNDTTNPDYLSAQTQFDKTSHIIDDNVQKNKTTLGENYDPNNDSWNNKYHYDENSIFDASAGMNEATFAALNTSSQNYLDDDERGNLLASYNSWDWDD